MKNTNLLGQIFIECPNTIFKLYVKDENEMTKIEMFMNNIRTVNKLGIRDIYNWCDRQGIVYRVRFHYQKEISLWANGRSYLRYFSLKHRFNIGYGTT